MLYDRFENEERFRSDFIRPLLTRMGFVAVAELHGTQEFGKDFVFSELTPFGFLKHYAAVVKHEKKVGQTAVVVCNTILAQIRQAFAVDFTLPDSPEPKYVSSVFVFSSGHITDNARRWLRSELGEERYGRNVHILDGERLFQLDLSASYRLGEQLVPRLRGLINELALNLAVWRSIADNLPKFPEGKGAYTHALESFAACPFLTNQIDVQKVIFVLQGVKLIDNIYTRLRFAPNVLNQATREHEVVTIRSLIRTNTKVAEEIAQQLANVLRTLTPLASS